MKSAELSSPYLTAREAAAYLRYNSVAALYKAVVDLDIPCRRRGGRTYLFHRGELEAWLSGHRGRSVRAVAAETERAKS